MCSFVTLIGYRNYTKLYMSNMLKVFTVMSMLMLMIMMIGVLPYFIIGAFFRYRPYDNGFINERLECWCMSLSSQHFGDGKNTKNIAFNRLHWQGRFYPSFLLSNDGHLKNDSSHNMGNGLLYYNRFSSVILILYHGFLFFIQHIFGFHLSAFVSLLNLSFWDIISIIIGFLLIYYFDWISFIVFYLFVGLVIAVYKSEGKVLSSLHFIVKDVFLGFFKSLFIYALTVSVIYLLLMFLPSVYSIFLKMVIILKISNTLRDIYYSDNEVDLIISLTNFIDLIFKLIVLMSTLVLMNIVDLLNPVESLNENFNNHQPNNPQPNNPQPNYSEPSSPQSDNPQFDRENQIKNSIVKKVKERMDDPGLNDKTNLFHKTGKSHDFTSEEENYITRGLNDKLERNRYFKKTDDIGISKLTYPSRNAINGDCLTKCENGDLLKVFRNNKSNLRDLKDDINRKNNSRKGRYYSTYSGIRGLGGAASPPRYNKRHFSSTSFP